MFSLPYYVARDQGYFADEGLEIEFVKRNYGDRSPNLTLIEDRMALRKGKIVEAAGVLLSRGAGEKEEVLGIAFGYLEIPL
ncbi:MAG: ABC transporter substrate-binding protein [Nostoc sp.]|uniref:ABC transporter substrate-binding protein n=1 Tax=Nostoc sp. TaxID=1180 RepID=UPI002FF50112